MAETFSTQDNKIKEFIENVQFAPGDKGLFNLYGGLLLLTNDDLRRSISILAAGRFFERPDINRDAATLMSVEAGDIDKMLTTHGKTSARDNDEHSYIAANADKIRLNARNGSVGITGAKDIVLSSNKKTIMVTGEDLEITIGGNAVIKIKGTTTIESSGNLVMKSASRMNIESSGEMTIKSPTVTIDSNNISLGKGATEPAVLGTTMQTWDNIHQHPSAAGPTNPPTKPLDPRALSRVVKVK